MIGHITSTAILNSPLAASAQYLDPDTGESRALRVVLHKDVYRDDGRVIIRQTELSYRKGESLKTAATITVHGEDWRVGDVQQDDGYLVRVALKPFR